MACGSSMPSQQIVEALWYYPYYQVFFGICYAAATVVCITFYTKTPGLRLSSMRAQVLFCLSLGTLLRGISFYGWNCVIESIFRVSKDVFWFSSYAIIVFFWIELQKWLMVNKQINKLRKSLYLLLTLFVINRIADELFQPDHLDIGFMYQGCLGITILFYAGLCGVAQYGVYGIKRRMRTSTTTAKSSSKTPGKRLKRLTNFILLENVFLLLLVSIWAFRTMALDREDIPVAYFWVKTGEKFVELCLIWVLVLTITAKSAKTPATGPGPHPSRSGSWALRSLPRATHAVMVAPLMKRDANVILFFLEACSSTPADSNRFRTPVSARRSSFNGLLHDLHRQQSGRDFLLTHDSSSDSSKLLESAKEGKVYVKSCSPDGTVFVNMKTGSWDITMPKEDVVCVPVAKLHQLRKNLERSVLSIELANPAFQLDGDSGGAAIDESLEEEREDEC